MEPSAHSSNPCSSPSTAPATVPDVCTMMQLCSMLVASVRTCTHKGAAAGWWQGNNVLWTPFEDTRSAGIHQTNTCSCVPACPAPPHLRAGAPGWLAAAHTHVAAQVQQSEGGQLRPGQRHGSLQDIGCEDGLLIGMSRCPGQPRRAHGRLGGTRACHTNDSSGSCIFRCSPACPPLTPRLLLARRSSCRPSRARQVSGSGPDR